jgi:Ca2+-binding EF-hand superfamily protein
MFRVIILLTFTEKGFRPSAEDINEMFEEAVEGGRKILFSEFVTMMETKLNSMDDASTLTRAFESFDPTVNGVISHDDFKKICAFGKTKFTDAEVRIQILSH